MSGMGTGLNTNNPTIVSAFHRALLHQGLVVLAIVFLVALAWNLLRSAQLRAAAGKSGSGREAPRFVYPEAPARRLLRVSFGLLWIFDGILQGQASMPLGMGPQVIQPAAAASPTWVQHLDNSMATIWSYHPIAAPAAAVWIQIGIGLWLLAAPRGNWSRLGGVASVGWGLIVWIFGEAFGQIFAPGLTWLFGAPGSGLVLLRGGSPDRPARAAVGDTAPGQAHPAGHRGVLCRHGIPAGLARSRLLAGPVQPPRRGRDASPPWSNRWPKPRSLICSPRGRRPSPASTPPMAGRSTCLS